MKFVLAILAIALASCANQPSRNETQNRKPAQEASPEEMAAIQAEMARPQSATEYNFASVLGSHLPANIFNAIFGQDQYPDRAAVLKGFKFSDGKIFDSSLKQPVLIFNSGVNMSSSLLAIKQNIFIEGLYRQLEWEGGGFKKIAIPYFKYDAGTHSFHYIADGAQPLLVSGLTMIPGAFDAKTGLVTLYRGTDKAQLIDLQNLRDLLKKNAAQGIAEAVRLATKYKNGLFTSNLMATAELYADKTNPAVITVKIPKVKLDQLVTSGGVYVGYEYRYFELSFVSPAALAEYAKDMVDSN